MPIAVAIVRIAQLAEQRTQRVRAAVDVADQVVQRRLGISPSRTSRLGGNGDGGGGGGGRGV
jgi:hypothetical protein